MRLCSAHFDSKLRPIAPRVGVLDFTVEVFQLMLKAFFDVTSPALQFFHFQFKKCGVLFLKLVRRFFVVVQLAVHPPRAVLFALKSNCGDSVAASENKRWHWSESIS